MSKNRKKKRNQKSDIEPFDKSDWKKLDETEKFKIELAGKWVQKGPYIVNTSGKLDYAIYIGVEKRLVGIDETGEPVLESI